MSKDKKVKEGKVVNVYAHPVTGEGFEGRAVVQEIERPDEGDGLSLCWVLFQDDDFECLRTINEENAAASDD